MKATGIMCPCRQELEPFLKILSKREEIQVKRFEFFTGYIACREVVLCNCGIGKVNSAVATQMMIDSFDIGAVIVSGTAGATDGQLALFDTVICEEAVYHDLMPGCLGIETPHMEDAIFKAEDGLTEKLTGKRYVRGCIASGDSFADKEGRARIAKKTGAICADMETAAIAHCCYMNDMPFAAIRTITDTPEQGGLQNCLANFGRAAELSAAAVVEMIKISEYTKLKPVGVLTDITESGKI